MSFCGVSYGPGCVAPSQLWSCVVVVRYYGVMSDIAMVWSRYVLSGRVRVLRGFGVVLECLVE